LHSASSTAHDVPAKEFLQPDNAASSAGRAPTRHVYKSRQSRYLDASTKIAATLARKVEPGNSD